MTGWQQWLAGLRLWVSTFVSSLVILAGYWLLSRVFERFGFISEELSTSTWFHLANIGLYILVVPVLNYKIALFFGIDTVERIRSSHPSNG